MTGTQTHTRTASAQGVPCQCHTRVAATTSPNPLSPHARRLATYVAGLKCFTIEIAKNYRITEFREDLKGLYRQAGCANKPSVFLFDETQIVYETFLEDVNNILTSGEVGGPAERCGCSGSRVLAHMGGAQGAGAQNCVGIGGRT